MVDHAEPLQNSDLARLWKIALNSCTPANRQTQDGPGGFHVKQHTFKLRMDLAASLQNKEHASVRDPRDTPENGDKVR